jgi:hypothetical protein
MFILKAEKAIEISVHNHRHPDRDQRDNMNDIQLLKMSVTSHNNIIRECVIKNHSILT